VNELDGLDLLVTNAGGPSAGTFELFDDSQWDKAINLSFLSHVRLIRSALPHLKKSTAASVLTMTSYTAKQPLPNLVLSNSIRLATIGLTKSLALELGGEGVRFNSILPATIDTDRIRELQRFRAQINNTTVEEEYAKDARNSVFGRIGRSEEFANAAVFLLSPAASYITGVMLVVDGGQYKGTF
jgi:3-oxoacyl-[acyl-carrier protein] reductase